MKEQESLDKLIEEYSSELMGFAAVHSYPSSQENNEDTMSQEDTDDIEAEEPEEREIKDSAQPSESEEESPDGKDEEITDTKENLYTARNLMQQEDEPSQPAEPVSDAPVSDNPKANPDNYATFSARIFAAQGAFPIEGAKVIVKRLGEIHSYLLTNGSGETKTVLLESYPKENSLEPLNPDQRTDYTADVYAEGFESKKDLLVSAVGGSEVILQEYMTPLQQGGT